MYLSHFNLKKSPFKTDPEFLWLGRKHREALETLQYGILHHHGYVVMTGDIGTGKTTIASALVNDLGDKVVVGRIPYPEVDTVDFSKLISTAFGISVDFQDRASFLVLFESFLRRSFSTGKKVVLIVDEAQRLNHGHLEELLHLSHIEENGTRLLNIVFVGQNEFNGILLEESNEALRQRVAVTYNLGALTQEETRQYILHRLRVAQCEGEIFTSEAIRDIFLFSRGIPRLINTVCDLALLMTYSQGGKRVLPETVKHSVERLRLPNEKAEFIRMDTDRSSGMARKVETKIREAGRQEVHAERVRESVRKPAWLRGAYAAVFGYLIVLSGLFFFLYRYQVQQRSTYEASKKQGIKKSGIAQPEMGSLKVKGSPRSGSLAAKELPLSQIAVEDSDHSARQQHSSALEEIRPSKGVRAPSAKTEGRKGMGSRGSVGPSGQSLTDPSREEGISGEKEKDLKDGGRSASGDSSGGLSQSPGFPTGRSGQEISSKDTEETDPGRAIDWLLEKRGDKK